MFLCMSVGSQRDGHKIEAAMQESVLESWRRQCVLDKTAAFLSHYEIIFVTRINKAFNPQTMRELPSESFFSSCGFFIVVV